MVKDLICCHYHPFFAVLTNDDTLFLSQSDILNASLFVYAVLHSKEKQTTINETTYKTNKNFKNIKII